MLAQLLAYRAWRAVAGRPPINVTFIFEGEEESSSPNLAQFVREHRDLLKADLVGQPDGRSTRAGGRPSRWASAAFSTSASKPAARRDHRTLATAATCCRTAWELVHLLSTLRESDGRVLIQGFYDDVRTLK